MSSVQISKFSFIGRVPSKKNSKRIFVSKNGKPIVLSSESHNKWNADVVSELKKEKKVGAAKEFILEFWFKDYRRTDMTNITESIMDAFVDAEIIDDDAWNFTGPITLIPMGIDKDNPRVAVTMIY